MNLIKRAWRNLRLEERTKLFVSKVALVESVRPVNDPRFANSFFKRRGMTTPVGGLLQAAELLTCPGTFL
jgi:hypothetical protein